LKFVAQNPDSISQIGQCVVVVVVNGGYVVDVVVNGVDVVFTNVVVHPVHSPMFVIVTADEIGSISVFEQSIVPVIAGNINGDVFVSSQQGVNVIITLLVSLLII
jgi:hypothetical protein